MDTENRWMVASGGGQGWGQVREGGPKVQISKKKKVYISSFKISKFLKTSIFKRNKFWGNVQYGNSNEQFCIFESC